MTSKLARWIEEINNIQVDMIDWSSGNKLTEHKTFWQKHWLNIWFYGLMLSSIGIMYLLGWIIFARLIMFIVGIKIVLQIWGLLKWLKNLLIKYLTSLWK